MLKNKLIYRDILCSHEAEVLPLMMNVLRKFNPELIIEFGTGSGGMTLLFQDICTNAEIYSYDTNKDRVKTYEFYEERTHIINADILSHPSYNIISLCIDKRRKLLYCDNGNKKKEMNMYSKFLNINDMIACHDWPREINESHIQNLNIIPFKHKLFKDNNCSSRFWKIL